MVKGPEPSDGVDAFRIAIYFVPACCILLTAAWFSLLARGVISGLVFVVLLLLNLPIADGRLADQSQSPPRIGDPRARPPRGGRHPAPAELPQPRSADRARPLRRGGRLLPRSPPHRPR